MSSQTRATIDDLRRVPENRKVELVKGAVVLLSPTGGKPGRAAGTIYVSLRQFERVMPGYAYPDNVGFLVKLPERESFSPDAAFHVGAPPDIDFVDGEPILAVEVRSKNDYGLAAEQAMADKRADYFAAGAEVVWDVDLLGEDVVRVYRADDPARPTIYRRGEVAEAEPALPGWRLPVDDLFS